MAHTSLSILAVSPELSLSAYTKNGILATNTSGPAQEILVLSHVRAVMAHASINFRAVQPELFL